MPLVVMCGFPCSGKSTRTRQLKGQLKKLWPVEVVTDDDGLVRNNVYADASLEKQLRDRLKSDVARLLSRDALVIIDALNYIKGFRYELYCLTREARTTHCVVHPLVPQEMCEQWNMQRPEVEQYTPEAGSAGPAL